MDPITIGLAFVAAQEAVKHIKQAVALGKDIHGLIGQFSKFFESADTVHIASTKARVSNVGKSNAQIGRQALEFAMHSNKLREDERAIKDMILWELGKPQIWEDMIKERTRLMKERFAEERALEEQKHKHKKKMADLLMYGIIFVGGSVVLFSLLFGGIAIYGVTKEREEYEAKVAQRIKVIRQQQLTREIEKAKKDSG
jgi:hypothetical protein